MSLDHASALAGPVFPPGEVRLVGAGPGDPGLLTLRAVESLRAADLVLHDALPGRAVLRHAGRGAVLEDVGKRRGHAPVPQAAINARLVAAARAGLRVVRLKGGDPFLFGRGAEEAAACDAAGVPWRVVPGVSAGLAAPAASGIAVTRRGVASAVTFVTARDESGALPALDWGALPGTLAVFMGLAALDEVATRLLAAGRGASTPVAIIARAGLPGQATLRTTLGACTLAARRAALPGPALVVVGEAAAAALPLAAIPLPEAIHA